MSRIIWGESGNRFYEAGVDRGVFYPLGQFGVPWNGLLSVKEAPSDSTSEINYYDGVPYRSDKSAGNFAATIDALTYPEELTSDPFNFSYRTKLGNDTQGLDLGYKLHLVFNARVTPTAKNFQSINSDPSVVPYTLHLSTTPVQILDAKASAHLIVDSTKAYSSSLEEIENMLYGTVGSDPTFPTIDQVFDIFEDTAILKITNHGDGTWTAEGPDDVVFFLDDTTFEIVWPSVVYIESDEYRVKSL